MRTETGVVLFLKNKIKIQSVPIEILDLYVVCRAGEHAGGVIFVDAPFTESTALMKVPNGDIVTQYDLHDCEDCSQPMALGY